MAISLVLRCAVLAALLNAASGLLLKPQPPRSISRRSALAGGLVAVVSLPVQAAKEPTASSSRRRGCAPSGRCRQEWMRTLEMTSAGCQAPWRTHSEPPVPSRLAETTG